MHIYTMHMQTKHIEKKRNVIQRNRKMFLVIELIPVQQNIERRLFWQVTANSKVLKETYWMIFFIMSNILTL